MSPGPKAEAPGPGAKAASAAARGPDGYPFPLGPGGQPPSFVPSPHGIARLEEDIVFCEVQPTRRFYAHLVKTKEWSDDWGCWVYWISNLKGRVNGWCRIEHIHGKLFQVWR